jgi:hypothetical protein
MGLPLEKLPDWPAAMNRELALSYLGVAPKLFDQLDRTGGLRGKRIGRNGEKLYPREQLDALLTRLFGPSALDIDDELEGLNG